MMVLGTTFARGYQGWEPAWRRSVRDILPIEQAGHRALSHIEKPLHFFNGAMVIRAATVSARRTQRAQGRD